jgi:hypothetical protein
VLFFYLSRTPHETAKSEYLKCNKNNQISLSLLFQVGTMDEQFMILIGALDKIPGIVFRYHNYPGVVLPALSLLSKSAKRMLHSVQPQNVNK